MDVSGRERGEGIGRIFFESDNSYEQEFWTCRSYMIDPNDAGNTRIILGSIIVFPGSASHAVASGSSIRRFPLWSFTNSVFIFTES
jgi:hypothetical protein